jgi:hypothetical protein
MDGLRLPRLQVCDLRDNKLKDAKDVIAFAVQSPGLVSIDLSGCPIVASRPKLTVCVGMCVGGLGSGEHTFPSPCSALRDLCVRARGEVGINCVCP